MIAVEHTQSVNAFRQNAAETLDRVNETGEAETISVDGEARGVLLSPAAYDGLANEAHIASMRRAIQQFDAGQGQDLHAAMHEIRAEPSRCGIDMDRCEPDRKPSWPPGLRPHHSVG